MKTQEWLAAAAGVVVGLGYAWIRDKFIVLEYKIEQLENPEVRRTNAEGGDADPEADEVRGQIGYWRGNGRA